MRKVGKRLVMKGGSIQKTFLIPTEERYAASVASQSVHLQNIY